MSRVVTARAFDAKTPPVPVTALSKNVSMLHSKAFIRSSHPFYRTSINVYIRVKDIRWAIEDLHTNTIFVCMRAEGCMFDINANTDKFVIRKSEIPEEYAWMREMLLCDDSDRADQE